MWTDGAVYKLRDIMKTNLYTTCIIQNIIKKTTWMSPLRDCPIWSIKVSILEDMNVFSGIHKSQRQRIQLAPPSADNSSKQYWIKFFISGYINTIKNRDEPTLTKSCTEYYMIKARW